jgi:hypothetical protein
MSANTLLACLSGVKKIGDGRWMARCPAHDDKHPSLSIRELDDGRILVNDFGGCGAAEVLGALGLSFDCLFPTRPLANPKAIRRPVFREDAFAAIVHEATIVWLVGCDIHKHKEISEESYQRLGDAVATLGRMRDVAYGR